jgi:hypothetical protein
MKKARHQCSRCHRRRPRSAFEVGDCLCRDCREAVPYAFTFTVADRAALLQLVRRVEHLVAFVQDAILKPSVRSLR